MPEPITQLEHARSGSITPAMEAVAKLEDLQPEKILEAMVLDPSWRQ